MRVRTAVLASGGGSNLQALLDHLAVLGAARALDVVLVASDRPAAGALERGRRAGIAALGIGVPRNGDAPSLDALLQTHDVGLVVLAGYLRLVPAEVTQRFAHRMVNVHPAPLPRFGGTGMYGARVHRAVLDAGADRTGPTVHYVDAIYDHGDALAHWPVPVRRGDDAQALAARVLRAEHLLYPRVVQRVASALQAHGGAELPFPDLPLFDPELDDAILAQQVDAALAR